METAIELLKQNYGWPPHVAKSELELAKVTSRKASPEEVAQEIIDDVPANGFIGVA